MMEKIMLILERKKIFLTVLGALAIMLCVGTVRAQDILCPEPSNIATTAPADLAQVQSDIDRLSLCVERAKLLSELDKSIDEREKGDKNSMLDSLQPLTPKAADVSRVMQQQNLGIAPVPMEQPLNQDEESEDKQPVPTADWKIRRIWGARGNTKAQLGKDNGIVATVVKNDVLPDGYVVVELSTIGVTIRKNGKSKELAWSVANTEEQ